MSLTDQIAAGSQARLAETTRTISTATGVAPTTRPRLRHRPALKRSRNVVIAINGT